MIEKLKLATAPDEHLLLSFVMRATPADADNLLVEFTAHEMREKLQLQRDRGFNGWNTAQCENANLRERLLNNVETGDWINVINLAAMLLARAKMFEEIELARKAG